MASKEPVRVLLTPAAGNIGLVYMFAGGSYMLGADQPVILHLHDNPSAAEALNGLKKKLVDGDFPLLEGVVATTDVVEACTGVNIAVVDAGFSSEKGTEAKDFMPIYESLDLALGKHAAADCKVLAVGDPANTSELFSESSIPAKNITCFARLDHYLASSGICRVLAGRVENAFICGNRPWTPYPDMSFATVKTPYWEKSGHHFLADYVLANYAWMDGEFITKASKCSSAMSAASSARDPIRDRETLVSMGRDYDGSHSVPAGRNRKWLIVEDLGNPTPANFQWEVEGKFKQNEERLAMFSNQLKELENEAGTALHQYSSRIDEFERHANRAFENVCNKIEFLEREIANLESNLANAQVYLHRAFQEVAKWRQLYWNLRSRVIPSRG